MPCTSYCEARNKKMSVVSDAPLTEVDGNDLSFTYYAPGTTSGVRFERFPFAIMSDRFVFKSEDLYMFYVSHTEPEGWRLSASLSADGDPVAAGSGHVPVGGSIKYESNADVSYLETLANLTVRNLKIVSKSYQQHRDDTSAFRCKDPLTRIRSSPRMLARCAFDLIREEKERVQGTKLPSTVLPARVSANVMSALEWLTAGNHTTLEKKLVHTCEGSECHLHSTQRRKNIGFLSSVESSFTTGKLSQSALAFRDAIQTVLNCVNLVMCMNSQNLRCIFSKVQAALGESAGPDLQRAMVDIEWKVTQVQRLSDALDHLSNKIGEHCMLYVDCQPTQEQRDWRRVDPEEVTVGSCGKNLGSSRQPWNRPQQLVSEIGIALADFEAYKHSYEACLRVAKDELRSCSKRSRMCMKQLSECRSGACKNPCQERVFTENGDVTVTTDPGGHSLVDGFPVTQTTRPLKLESGTYALTVAAYPGNSTVALRKRGDASSSITIDNPIKENCFAAGIRKLLELSQISAYIARETNALAQSARAQVIGACRDLLGKKKQGAPLDSASFSNDISRAFSTLRYLFGGGDACNESFPPGTPALCRNPAGELVKSARAGDAEWTHHGARDEHSALTNTHSSSKSMFPILTARAYRNQKTSEQLKGNGHRYPGYPQAPLLDSLSDVTKASVNRLTREISFTLPDGTTVNTPTASIVYPGDKEEARATAVLRFDVDSHEDSHEDHLQLIKEVGDDSPHSSKKLAITDIIRVDFTLPDSWHIRPDPLGKHWKVCKTCTNATLAPAEFVELLEKAGAGATRTLSRPFTTGVTSNTVYNVKGEYFKPTQVKVDHPALTGVSSAPGLVSDAKGNVYREGPPYLFVNASGPTEAQVVDTKYVNRASGLPWILKDVYFDSDAAEINEKTSLLILGIKPISMGGDKCWFFHGTDPPADGRRFRRGDHLVKLVATAPAPAPATSEWTIVKVDDDTALASNVGLVTIDESNIVERTSEEFSKQLRARVEYEDRHQRNRKQAETKGRDVPKFTITDSVSQSRKKGSGAADERVVGTIALSDGAYENVTATRAGVYNLSAFSREPVLSPGVRYTPIFRSGGNVYLHTDDDDAVVTESNVAKARPWPDFGTLVPYPDDKKKGIEKYGIKFKRVSPPTGPLSPDKNDLIRLLEERSKQEGDVITLSPSEFDELVHENPESLNDARAHGFDPMSAIRGLRKDDIVNIRNAPSTSPKKLDLNVNSILVNDEAGKEVAYFNKKVTVLKYIKLRAVVSGAIDLHLKPFPAQEELNSSWVYYQDKDKDNSSYYHINVFPDLNHIVVTTRSSYVVLQTLSSATGASVYNSIRGESTSFPVVFTDADDPEGQVVWKVPYGKYALRDVRGGKRKNGNRWIDSNFWKFEFLNISGTSVRRLGLPFSPSFRENVVYAPGTPMAPNSAGMRPGVRGTESDVILIRKDPVLRWPSKSKLVQILPQVRKEEGVAGVRKILENLQDCMERYDICDLNVLDTVVKECVLSRCTGGDRSQRISGDLANLTNVELETHGGMLFVALRRAHAHQPESHYYIRVLRERERPHMRQKNTPTISLHELGAGKRGATPAVNEIHKYDVIRLTLPCSLNGGWVNNQCTVERVPPNGGGDQFLKISPRAPHATSDVAYLEIVDSALSLSGVSTIKTVEELKRHGAGVVRFQLQETEGEDAPAATVAVRLLPEGDIQRYISNVMRDEAGRGAEIDWETACARLKVDTHIERIYSKAGALTCRGFWNDGKDWHELQSSNTAHTDARRKLDYILPPTAAAHLTSRAIWTMDTETFWVTFLEKVRTKLKEKKINQQSMDNIFRSTPGDTGNVHSRLFELKSSITASTPLVNVGNTFLKVAGSVTASNNVPALEVR
jgi:hypothetical protein